MALLMCLIHTVTDLQLRLSLLIAKSWSVNDMSLSKQGQATPKTTQYEQIHFGQTLAEVFRLPTCSHCREFSFKASISTVWHQSVLKLSPNCPRWDRKAIESSGARLKARGFSTVDVSSQILSLLFETLL